MAYSARWDFELGIVRAALCDELTAPLFEALSVAVLGLLDTAPAVPVSILLDVTQVSRIAYIASDLLPLPAFRAVGDHPHYGWTAVVDGRNPFF